MLVQPNKAGGNVSAIASRSASLYMSPVSGLSIKSSTIVSSSRSRSFWAEDGAGDVAGGGAGAVAKFSGVNWS